MKLNNQILIIDFDSTFIKLESLDELAYLVLSQNENKEQLVDQIRKITEKGMRGEISFEDSLSARLKLFKPQKVNLDFIVKKLKQNISRSFVKNRDFFINNRDNIYIISGGFRDFIEPVVKDFKIKTNQILANEFIFDKKGEFIDINWKNPLTKEGGKIRQVELLSLTGEVVVVGDGWTDYQIKEAGKADKFLGFFENIYRSEVAKVADERVYSFDEIIDFLKKSYVKRK